MMIVAMIVWLQFLECYQLISQAQHNYVAMQIIIKHKSNKKKKKKDRDNDNNSKKCE